MRIASLVPSATEICGALGLAGELVAVTHECDHPPGVERLPHLTRSVIGEGLSAGEIDAAVQERTAAGEALYELDVDLLAELDVDLILAQQVCAVCAVSYEDVLTVARRLPTSPRVISLDPVRLADVLDDAVLVAEAAGHEDRGLALRGELAARIEAVRAATTAAARPRVVALEWLDPPYAGGHWIPEMIAAAGGLDVLAEPGDRSRELGWEEIGAARADVAVIMPCGLGCEQSHREAERHAESLRGLGVERAHAVDAAASFSRPGPRLADGVELLGHLLHPELVAAPSGLRSLPLSAAAT